MFRRWSFGWPSLTGRFWQGRVGRFLALLLSTLTLLGCLHLAPQLSTGYAVPPTSDPSQLVQRGSQQFQAGQFGSAISLFQEAARLFEHQGDRLNQAIVLSNLAIAYQQLGQLGEANRSIKDSLQWLSSASATTPDVRSRLAQALNIQGSLKLTQGQIQSALTTWQKATQIYQQLQDTPGTVRSLINQSQALRALGLYPRARQTLQQVAQLLQDQPDSSLKAAALLNFGDMLRLIGDLQQSQTVLQQSLTLARQQPERSPLVPDESMILLSLGNTARAQEQPTHALTYYQQAASTAKSPMEQVQIQLNQLRLLLETEQWRSAVPLSKEIAAQLSQLPAGRMTVYAHVNYAQSLLKLKAHADIRLTEIAQTLAIAVEQAKALGDMRAEAYATGYLGSAYEQSHQWPEAKQLTEQAMMLAQAINAPDIAYRWQWQLGRLLTVMGNQTAAIAAYSQAVNTLSTIRSDLVANNNLEVQFSFRESVEPVYRQLVSLLLQPTDQATTQTNLKRAREVIESLQLAELDNFFREACLTGRSAPVDRIDPKAAVLYPIILDDRLEVVLSLPNQSLQHYSTAIPRTQLEPLLSQMRRSLRRTALEPERLAIAQKLYDLLIRPAEPDLTRFKIQTLAFVLDGGLNNLPMSALHDGQQYLIEKYAIALTPGLQLFDPRALERQRLKVLLGGLSEARSGFVPLPGVEQEIRQIKAEIPAQVLLNHAFTKDALQYSLNQTSFPVVHLATHGQFSSNADETFILAWDKRINVKQLGDLLQTRLVERRPAIELLVLSACQTADGDRRAALGLAGVAVRSGARSTLATLWPVDDQSTSQFMVNFYQELTKPEVTKSEALRQAQITLLKQPEFDHPYYWAPFILVGNWL